MAGLPAVAGAGLLGLAVGIGAGLSTTGGTTKRALGVLGTLAGTGGLVGWTQGVDEIGLLVGGVSGGFVVGLLAGIQLRDEEEGFHVYEAAPPTDEGGQRENPESLHEEDAGDRGRGQ